MTRAFVIILFIAEELYSILLLYLSASAAKRELPDEVKDVYDSTRYSLYKAYRKDNLRTQLLSSATGMIADLILLVGNVYSSVFNALSPLNIYPRYFLVILIFTLIDRIIELPFSYYDTFVIEEKYGMNRTTKKTFFLDRMKSFIVSMVLTSLLISVIIFFFTRFGIIAIVWTAAAVIVFSLFANLLLMLFMRLFNTFTPLEEGELKNKLLSLCTKYGVRVKRIVVRDASRRTTKANAFCSGLRKKTISIDDNLMNNFTSDEIVAVFAHEFAHAKYRHVLKTLPFSLISSVIMIAAFGVLLGFSALFTAFGFEEENYFFAFLLLSTITWPVTIPFNTFLNSISRKHEYEADAFAAEEGYGEALVSALKRLMNEALSEINPHPWIVVTEYSHPTLSERIESIRKHEKQK